MLSVELVGIADVDGDGQDELVVSLMCSGTEIEHCCAGQTSIMTSVAAYRQESGGLRLVAPGLMGGQWLPGDESGPISRRGINAAALDGSTLVTTEYTPYSHMYSVEDLHDHDPSEWITARYVVRDARGCRSRDTALRQGPGGTCDTAATRPT
ncbi:hypothetical protein [Ornithinimicrobium avium]|uniref:Uncharacterized protein n=1 Tax=Ornithinimicrobium avium TaxID=2283195 RepID=A0A345NKB1_9MICO|nr:hypothetical protein [Ornithinimicrobium avium]AXH95469.1 hypothetical protein DV701_04385 [Ornithinimicrobium avium]